jgi:hypothetical protein
MMAKDKGNPVFRKVMHGTNNRVPSSSERREDERRAKQLKADTERLAKESRELRARLEREKRAEIAHARAEADRRKHKQ